MSFFSKLKDNFKHGGVQVTMQAPMLFSPQDSAMPVTVTLVNSAEPRNIKSVKSEIRLSYLQSTVTTPGTQIPQNQQNQRQRVTETIVKATFLEPFSLQANETKSIAVNIQDAGPTLASFLRSRSLGMENVIGSAVKGLADLDERPQYTVYVSADVEGIVLDPHAEQSLQIDENGVPTMQSPDVDIRPAAPQVPASPSITTSVGIGTSSQSGAGALPETPINPTQQGN